MDIHFKMTLKMTDIYICDGNINKTSYNLEVIGGLDINA